MRSHLFGDLDVAEAEIVFPLLDSIKKEDLPADADPKVNTYLEQDKQQIALQLFIAYRDGLGVVANEQIAEVYLALYLLCPKPEESFFDNILFWFSWFTTLRLGILRSDRELALLPFSSQHDHSIQFNKALQLSYFLEIIVGIGKLFYYSFRPKTKEDDRLGTPWYKRFDWARYNKIKNSSQFTNFMSNAVVWFVANGLSLICVAWLTSLGASDLAILVFPSLIQLTGFGYDIWHDYEYAAEERDKHEKSYLLVTRCQNEDEPKVTLNNILKNKALNKVNASSEKISRVVKIAVGIFIGMALLYFLPLLSPYIASYLPLLGATNFLLSYDTGKKLVDIVTEILKTLGSTIVVAAGFLYGGLCGRLWRLESWTKSASWLWNFFKSNVLELVAASLLLYFGIIAAIPLVGAAIVGLGVPVAFALTFIAVRGIVSICNQVWQCLWPPAVPALSQEELTNLGKVLSKVDDIFLSNTISVKMLQKSLSADERLLLKKASGLNDSEWLKHIRNWSLSSEKREISLCYESFSFLCDQLRNKFNLSKQKNVPEQEITSPVRQESFAERKRVMKVAVLNLASPPTHLTPLLPKNFPPTVSMTNFAPSSTSTRKLIRRFSSAPSLTTVSRSFLSSDSYKILSSSPFSSPKKENNVKLPTAEELDQKQDKPSYLIRSRSRSLA